MTHVDADIVTAPIELTEELRKHVHRPTELIVSYDPSPHYPDTKINYFMRDTCPHDDELHNRFVKAGEEVCVAASES